CAGGQTSVVITCTGGAGGSPEIYAAGYEGAGGLAADKSSRGDSNASNATWSSGAAAVTPQAREIFFGAVSARAAVPAVTRAGAGRWTTQSNATGVLDQVSGFQAVSSAGTAAFSGTLSPAGGYTALAATFYAVAPVPLSLAASAVPGASLTAGERPAGVLSASAGAGLAGGDAVADAAGCPGAQGGPGLTGSTAPLGGGPGGAVP